MAATFHKNSDLSQQQFLSLLSSVTWNWTLVSNFYNIGNIFSMFYFVLLSQYFLLKTNPADLFTFPLMNPINWENNKEKQENILAIFFFHIKTSFHSFIFLLSLLQFFPPLMYQSCHFFPLHNNIFSSKSVELGSTLFNVRVS